MSWEKYRDHLSKMLEMLDQTQDKDMYLILWLKIYRLCLESMRNFPVPPKHKPILINLIEKYKTKVQPALVQYLKDQKATPIQTTLKQYKDKLFHQFELAEENLKYLPLKSLEILENTLFFIDLYHISLNKSILSTSKEIVRKKIHLLKQSFEVEGGTRDIEVQQKQLTESYLNKLQGTPLPMSTPFPEPVALPEIKENEIMEPSSDLVLGQLSFPEESTVPSRIDSSSDSVQVSEVPQSYPVPVTQTILPYATWYPAQNWTEFVNMRYDLSTGRIKR